VLTFERVVRESGGVPSATGFRTPLEIVYFNVGGMDYREENRTTLMAHYEQASKNAMILAQQLGAFGGFDSGPANGSWNTAAAPCPHCPLPFVPGGVTAPGYWSSQRGDGRDARLGRFPVLVPPTFGNNLPASPPR